MNLASRAVSVAGTVMLAAALLHGQGTQVVARVSTDTIGLQDQFQLSVTVTGNENLEGPPPRLPRLKGFQVVSGPGVSTQFQWMNGRSSSSRTYTWVLLPETEGTYTIDPIELDVGGRTYRTAPVTVKVMPQTQPRPRQPARPSVFDPFGDDSTLSQQRIAGDELMVVAEVDRNRAFPGQQITLTYRLLTQVSVTGINLQESPPLSGFWVEDLSVQQNQSGTRRVVNGREYVEYVVKRQALFANAPGKVRIPSSTFAVSAKSVGNLFGMFGPSETLYRKTRELDVDIRQLPAGKPADFGNAVGAFNLTTSLDKSEVAAGSAVTLRVKLDGRGNLKMIPDITLPGMPDFTVYSAKQAQNVRPFEDSVIGGEKTWEYVMVPRVPGQQTIPAMTFSYFDPSKERYETVTAPALSLRVLPGTVTTSSPLSGIQKQTLTLQGSDINFIKLTPDALDGGGGTPLRSAWFYVMLAIPLALSVGSGMYRQRRMREEENLPLARSRRAKRLALERLRQAGKETSDPRRFYDHAAAALMGYLTDKFGLPGIALTSDAVRKELEGRGIPAEAVSRTIAGLEECDFGRFVTATAPVERRVEFESRLRGIIEELERVAS